MKNNKYAKLLIFALFLMIGVIFAPESSKASEFTKFTRLPAPTVKTTTVKAKKVTATWNKVKGAKSYRIYIKKDSQEFRIKTTVKTTSYSFNGVYGHKYAVQVRAIDKCGVMSNVSNYKTVSTVKTPEAVSIRSTEDDGQKVEIQWYTCTGSTAIEVEVKEGNGAWTTAATTSDQSFTYKKPSADQNYSFRLRGINVTKLGTGYGEYTAELTTGPANIPTIQSITSSEKDIVVTWDAKATAKEYNVYVQKDSEEFRFRGTVTTNTFSYTDMSYDHTYTFRIQAIGKGNAMDTVSPTKSYALIKKPDTARIMSVAVSGTGAVIKWYTCTGATSVEIYAKLGGGAYTLVGKADASAKTYTASLGAAGDYTFQIRGVNETSLGTEYGEYSEESKAN